MHRRGFTAQHDNRDQGAAFEEVFEKQAKLGGYLPLRTGQRCIWIKGGRIKLIPGQLDYTVLERGNRAAFLDCKSYVEDFFTFSQLNEKQRDQAELLNDWGQLAGFVVWFMKSNEIAFFSGHRIVQAGPGSRFTVREGLPLGRLETMSLRPIYEEKEREGDEKNNCGVKLNHTDTLTRRSGPG